MACMPSMAESGSRRSYFQLVETSCNVSLKPLITALTSLAACLPKSCQFISRKYFTGSPLPTFVG
ncbi:hypothetical protein PMAG_b0316 [Pseudoalteromonas mariniglutinosa NCIMB 1770]|nr:hypothetical protein [Pseudoalteromonas mariniglutinosa NCIMB 1770]